jgi:PAS domain S-box-containing protein
MRDPADGRLLYVSPAYEVIWGRSCQSLYDSPGDWLAAIHPDDREWVAQAAVREVEGGGYDHEYRIVRGDGSIAWIRDRAFLVRDAAGRLVSVVGVADDVTERRRLEEQIRQAQKMEAVGRLSAGIAHDFNNLLTVILGNGELALSVLPGAHEAGPYVTEIIQTAKRAATLIGQLLAFSRQQVVAPSVLDVGAIVAEAEPMLVRLLGEAVQLEMVAGAPGNLVRANPGHLMQVILNVAINARDAMPSGGRLTIEVSNLQIGEADAALHPALSVGRYAVIRMSDTGTGMTPEVQAHLFEPFFTTKPAAKGTGLGMSVVYGIVKQCGGGIEVESEFAVGTTLRIYLPAADGAAIAVPEAPRPAEASVGAESILVVEDDERVRRMVVSALNRAGYRVVEAVDGTEAIRLLDRTGSNIDLVLSDVVMPGMSGREVAEHIRARHPGLRMLFTSGYTDDTVLLEGVLRADVPFLHKPFTPEELLEKIRQVLRGTRTMRPA